MNILIVDDEYLAIENMQRHLRYLGYDDVTTTTNVLEAVEWCKAQTFDTVFLDIEMPLKDGVKAAGEIHSFHPECQIIFVTAYSEYALKGYEVGAIDYVLKPVTSERLQVALGRAARQFSDTRGNAEQPQKLLVKAKERIAMINLRDIIYIEAQLNDTIAHTAEHSYFTGKRISEVEPLFLAESTFMKVHRSCLVNMESIDYFETVEQGKYCIHFRDTKNVVYTSRSGAQNIREYFEKLI